MNDLKFAFRQLLKNPGFTVVAVLSLSLGIAAITTIFSFVNVLLLRPPPVEAPGELWQVWRENLKGGSAFERYQGLSYPGYVFFRDHNQSFATLAAFDPETPLSSWSRDGIGQPIQCQFVSGNFFTACGIRASLGRTFGPEEDRQPGADPVAVVSYGFWRNHLGGDPQIIGKALTINGVSLTVVGVAPERFTGLLAGLSPDLWAPYLMAPMVLHDPEWHTRTGAFSHFGVGRLKPGVSAAQAEAELTALIRRLEETDPRHNKDFGAAVFRSTMVPSPFRGSVWSISSVLIGAAFMVLLIACANAANLMLARAVARRREMAVRSSIGATRWQLMRQVLTESVLLALLSGGFALKDYGYSPEQMKRFNDAFLERVGALPGIESVALADRLPLDTRSLGITYNVEGYQAPPEQTGYNLQTFDVGAGYFATMGTVLLRGREFVMADREGAPMVAIVNQTMADQFWPGQEIVGRRLFEGKPGKGDVYEIVGVVETGKYRTLGEEPRPVVFRSRLQHPRPRSTFVAHVRGDPQAALAAIRDATRTLDSRLSLARLETLDRHLALALFPARATGLLFSALGAVALLLAASGLFGVIAHSVSRRTREIGIRMALGAHRGTVVGLVLRQGMILAGAGTLIGLAGAFAATRLLRSLLLGVSPIDPVTFVLVPLLLLAVALLACLIPARKAARTDPMVALRHE